MKKVRVHVIKKNIASLNKKKDKSGDSSNENKYKDLKKKSSK